jgi:uncharacterized membrane-anchored protein YjiN (DUF445 family)
VPVFGISVFAKSRRYGTREPRENRNTEHRHRDLQRLALGLLALMCLVFVATHVYAPGGVWLGYVRAFSEAAMVGAIADWFAVTALFRHPLGLPIPHTAIVPRRKDQIGASLARFVRDHFLNRDALAPRLERIDFAAGVARWLALPQNARRLSADAAAFWAWLLGAADDKALRALLSENLHLGLSELKVTPLLGRLLDLLASADRHQVLMDEAVRIAREQLDENRYAIRMRIEEQSPWWLPGFVDEELYERIVTEIERFLDGVGTDAAHPARQRFNEGARAFIERLKSDAELIARGEALKQELLAHPAVQGYLGNLWERISGYLLGETAKEDSELKRRLERGLAGFGEALLGNEPMRVQINGWLGDAIVHVVSNYRDDMAGIIEETVRAWDARDAARRIELQVGRDLQFIRINGTLVGGLAGLVIHALVRLLG